MTELTLDDFYEDIDYVTAHFVGHLDSSSDIDKVKSELKWVFEKYYKPSEELK
jgi:hypothetical protein